MTLPMDNAGSPPNRNGAGASTPKRGSRRGQPLKAADERREKRVYANLTKAEYESLMDDYDPAANTNRAEYFRSRLLDKELHVVARDISMDEALPTFTEFNDQLQKAGTNLNQLVRHLNTYRAPALEEEVRELLVVVSQVAKLQTAATKELQILNDRWMKRLRK